MSTSRGGYTYTCILKGGDKSSKDFFLNKHKTDNSQSTWFCTLRVPHLHRRRDPSLGFVDLQLEEKPLYGYNHIPHKFADFTHECANYIS